MRARWDDAGTGSVGASAAVPLDRYPNSSRFLLAGNFLSWPRCLLIAGSTGTGKSVAINLVYTRCTASCPLETAKLTQVQRIFGDRMGKDVFFYSISIDPKNDTPEAMKAYMEKYHIGPGWLFLTGKVEDIKLIAQKLGLSQDDDWWKR